MRELFLKILAGILGIWLADYFIQGVEFKDSWQTLAIVGSTLGLINFFIKPILKFITTPLRVLTFGLFGLAINMGIIWTVDIFFEELIIKGLIPLFWTTLLLWGINLILSWIFYQSSKS